MIQNLKLAFAMHYIIMHSNATDFRYYTSNFIPINFSKSFTFSTFKCDTFNMAPMSNSPKSLWTSSIWVIFEVETIKRQNIYKVSEPFFDLTMASCDFHTLHFTPPHISPPLNSIVSMEPPLFITFTSFC